MGASLLAAVYGLVSAVSWGGGDFCGGLATRRAPVLWVLLIGQLCGLGLLVTLALAFGEPWLPWEAIILASASGVFGSVGLTMLYAALSAGRAALVATVSAVLAATVPVVVAAYTDGLPGPLRLFGFGLALVGIWLVAQSEEAGGGRKLAGVPQALFAGIGFGVFFVLIDRTGDFATFWPLAVARAVPVPVTLGLLLLRGQLRPLPRAALPVATLSGALDVGGNVFFLLASEAGGLAIAAVLSSLYPASTVVLSRFVLDETMTRVQVLGLLTVLVAIVLIVV